MRRVLRILFWSMWEETAARMAGALLKKGVIIRDMAAWGLKGYIRVSIGKPSENKRFIKTLGEIL